MNSFFRKKHWGVGLVGVLILAAGISDAAPLGRPGTVAHYELDGAPEDRPDFETENALSVVKAVIQLGPVERVRGGDNLQWYGLHFTRLNGDSYQMWILLDGWPTAEDEPHVAQYLWYESGWPDAVNFVHEVTGEAILPRICLWSYGWPQVPELGAGSERAPVEGMPAQILLQGYLYNQVDTERQGDLAPPESYTDITLNPDLINGWVAFDKDADGRPFYRMESGRYEYTEKSIEEIMAYFDAGSNFLVTHPSGRAREYYPEMQPELLRSSVYHNSLTFRHVDWPADLYRSNYWGYGNHVDEPGVHNWGLPEREGADEPLPEVQVANNLQRIVRHGVESRGDVAINDQIALNFGLGDMVIRETPDTIMTWEYEWPTVWYQLAVEDGVGGIVDEDATLNDLVETYNMGLGTQIPATVENAVAIRVAVLRGAARNFDKEWGVAFYHPNEVKLKSASIRQLYEKGASRFWYWTGWIGITDNSGLPYPYQVYYTSLVRNAFERNPDRDMDGLLRAAKVAVVIPYGYTFSPYHMHRIDWLHLERENQYGVTYREVLSNAAMEVERLLRLGIDFDIAVDDPLFHKTGYDELIYAQADGMIRIEQDGETVELREEPRPFFRPDLGPGPTMTLEVIESDDDKPGRIRFRAIPEIGTGEWAAERPEPLISWEVYGPDNRVTPSIFPEYGYERTLRVDDDIDYTMQHPIPEHLREQGGREAPIEGSYTVRAATADVFGRPAVAYKTIYVDNG